mmetsp:Transcript_47856/g.55131  ORF Transcript_47856/g.55131 Transcript_47856/m.55131 type:complete len:96 (-) Transcript_47856:18-305(-)
MKTNSTHRARIFYIYKLREEKSFWTSPAPPRPNLGCDHRRGSFVLRYRLKGKKPDSFAGRNKERKTAILNLVVSLKNSISSHFQILLKHVNINHL